MLKQLKDFWYKKIVRKYYDWRRKCFAYIKHKNYVKECIKDIKNAYIHSDERCDTYGSILRKQIITDWLSKYNIAYDAETYTTFIRIIHTHK